MYKKKTENSDNKFKATMLQDIAGAKNKGLETEELLLELEVFSKVGFVEARLELILPQNDRAYARKIIEILKK